MGLEIRILQLADRDTVLQYERQKLAQNSEPAGDLTDNFELQMQEWHAPWRTEALEHYLPLGWSFSVTSESSLQGYFIAQPQVFTRGLTQTLWVERIQFDSQMVLAALLEVAFKLCREKHFQRLLIAETPELSEALLELRTGHEWMANFERIPEQGFAIKTAKF